MPRKPTGNPRGRPIGSGTLGQQTRLTVRVPTDLYDRLEAYAEGRSYVRGTPQLARCVREALEHYLICPNKRQTRITPVPHIDTNGQTPIVHEEPAEPVAPTDAPHEALGFDQTHYYLGKLCPAQHAYAASGYTLRRKAKGDCPQCAAEHKRAARATRRQASA
jgi:hypothetical protein